MTDEQRQHLDVVVIADLDAGVLGAAQAEAAEAHFATCPVCSRLRAELAELPALLAALPAPAIPADVEARLDAAVERAALERSREQDAAAVTVLSPRRRRWIAPLAAAAAVIAAIGFLAPGLDPGGNGADDAATSGGAETFVEGGGAGEDAGPDDVAEPRLQLSSASFGDDVAAKVYDQPSATATDAPAFSVARQQRLDALLDQQGCPPLAALASARQTPVLLDGEPATLLSYGPLSRRVAVAISCADGRPAVRARTVLDLR